MRLPRNISGELGRCCRGAPGGISQLPKKSSLPPLLACCRLNCRGKQHEREVLRSEMLGAPTVAFFLDAEWCPGWKAPSREEEERGK
jgi:hypothetical protein